MSNNTGAAQNFEYKAEMKQLLNLIVHSLYTNPDVFLRELISNSSDALNKLRFKKLTDDSKIADPEQELRIDIKLDKENNTVTIEDTGIGMQKEDLINQLGTVASSGTLKFLNELKESGKKVDSNMIGKFGVGFYSVFMVTDEVTVETKFAEKDSQGFRWVSKGEDSYQIEEIEKESKGTKITFKLKEDYKEYAEDWKVKSIITRYSNFVDFPVYVNDEKVNTVTAIWNKQKDNVSEDEYNEFYKYISNDTQEPLGKLHLNIEGVVNFNSILFIPNSAAPTLFQDAQKKTLQLYSSNVFIQDDNQNILPDYLRFLEGVVDTEDLPLNVSREVTQNSPLMNKIKNIITKRVLSMLEEWADKDKEKYEKFFKEFGSLLKTGLNSDFSNKDRIIELVRFETSQTKDDELTSFNGYRSRMIDKQSEIYYVSGNSIHEIENNPNLEYFKENDIEVIYLTDPVDLFTFPYVNEYDGKKIVSIEKANLDIEDETKKDDTKSDSTDSLIEKFKEVLGDRVENVRISNRLVSSPATLVVGDQGMDAQTEKMMQMIDKNFEASKRILEINPNHGLIKNLSTILISNKDQEVLTKSIEQIYEGAMLLEGRLKSPSEFVSRMNELLERATKI